MKRAANLFDAIAERDNLRLAFWKSLKGKRDRPDAQAFASRLEHELQTLADAVHDGTLPLGVSSQFTIHDPKERIITAPCFGERVWKRRGRFGHGQLLLVRDLLIVHSEYGVAYLIEASPDGYSEPGSFDTIDGVCWNTLCLYGDKLLVRSELEAACIQIPARD